jgi:hypothetical protein
MASRRCFHTRFSGFQIGKSTISICSEAAHTQGVECDVCRLLDGGVRLATDDDSDPPG